MVSPGSDPASVAPADCYYESNRRKLHYLDWGERGAPLILIHGLGDNPYVFRDIGDMLSRHYHVIAPSLRGHGRSEAGGPYAITALLDDLDNLYARLRLDPAFLVGWSFGGDIATRFAVSRPDRCRGIGLLDSYDTADASFLNAFGKIPVELLAPPLDVYRSFDSYRKFRLAGDLHGVPEPSCVNDYLANSVSANSDGTVKPTFTTDVQSEYYSTLSLNEPRSFEKIAVPFVALFAAQVFSLAGLTDPDAARNWDRTFMAPIRNAEIEKIRRSARSAKIRVMPGTHTDFFFRNRDQICEILDEAFHG